MKRLKVFVPVIRTAVMAITIGPPSNILRASRPRALIFKKLNNQLVLSWTKAGFTLQSAPLASGTFTNIPGATSPYTNSMTSAQQYFRLTTP